MHSNCDVNLNIEEKIRKGEGERKSKGKETNAD